MFDDIREFITHLLSFGVGGVFFLLISWKLLNNPVVIIKAWTWLAKGLSIIFSKWRKKSVSSSLVIISPAPGTTCRMPSSTFHDAGLPSRVPQLLKSRPLNRTTASACLVAALNVIGVNDIQVKGLTRKQTGSNEFSRKLASNSDIYVNDAFGTIHRSHASLTGVPRVLRGGYIGLLVQKELKVFVEMLSSPARPFSLLIGGAKVSDKIPVIENLLPRLDHLMIGGAMAFTFMKEMGLNIGTSLLERDRLGAARKLFNDAEEQGVDIHLPADIVIAPSAGRPDLAQTVRADAIPDNMAGLDIGPRTVEEFGKIIRKSSTVVWNGPMGVFEIPPFDDGTRGIAMILSEVTGNGTVTVVGGGDSVRAVVEAGLEDKITFVSTGGGASLKLLQGAVLPALVLLGGGKQ